jgi:hypothetical protein
VFTAALATLRLGREIDVHALVGSVVRGHLPRRLPRLPAATLSRGCQVLLDFSDSMLPWWEDLRELAAQVAAVLGEERAAVYEFAGTPAEAQRWDVERERRRRLASGSRTSDPRRDRFRNSRHAVAAPRAAPSGAPSSHAACRWAAPLLFLVPWSRGYWPSHLGLHPQICPLAPGDERRDAAPPARPFSRRVAR